MELSHGFFRQLRGGCLPLVSPRGQGNRDVARGAKDGPAAQMVCARRMSDARKMMLSMAKLIGARRMMMPLAYDGAGRKWF